MGPLTKKVVFNPFSEKVPYRPLYVRSQASQSRLEEFFEMLEEKKSRFYWDKEEDDEVI